MGTTLERIDPYIEQLLDNDTVRENLTRAGSNLRAARSRAKGAKNAKRAVADRQLRARVAASVQAAGASIVALRHGREQELRKRRQRRVLVIVAAATAGAAAAAAAAVAASNGDLRARIEAFAGPDTDTATAGGTT